MKGDQSASSRSASEACSPYTSVKIAKLLWNACVSSGHSSGPHGKVLTTEITAGFFGSSVALTFAV